MIARFARGLLTGVALSALGSVAAVRAETTPAASSQASADITSSLPAEKDMIDLDRPAFGAPAKPVDQASAPVPASQEAAQPSPELTAPAAAPAQQAVLPAAGTDPIALDAAQPSKPSEQAQAPAAQPVAPQSAPEIAAPQQPAPAPTVEAAQAPALTPDLVKQALDEFVRAPGPAQARKEREALAAVYAARGFAPFWFDSGRETPAAAAAAARLTRAEDDGLDLRAYSIASFRGLSGLALAQAEIDLSLAIAAYGRQASGARIDPSRISALITAKPLVADAASILNQTAQAGATAGEALQAFNPPQPGYAALRAKLAELRRERPAVAPQAKIPAGPVLKVGMRDPRVPLVRARFGLDVGEATAPENTIYDTRIAGLIADFQRANGLPASGQLTSRTISVLSGGQPSRLENEILANMERWRWMPRDLGASRIEVNIPDYTVRLYRQNVMAHETRVVVGKVNTPTPVFSNKMQFVIVNPYWNVPPSILKKEMLPRLAQDPDYLARQGYEVINRRGQISVRQPPGARNALGRIKFMFPNEHAVYLHDTPSRHLFAQDRRAFSHGCVRVDKPFAFAEAVLGRDNGWSEDRVKKMIGGSERTVNLAEPLPIHIEYFTAWVDDTGRLQLRDDIYGYSARVRSALGLDG